ncbi:alpha/beta fold hydrolase [Hasllibacter sp. MH4015]|uniref:alpha/beta fold hydrolase n=1 Tax=Hasllibacter sp. MH4015 TaxID=2854029 RepID=UPI001CD66CC1|nr:alpha/beta fold hydrolase [Hasllibacter sp. MH4015]
MSDLHVETRDGAPHLTFAHALGTGAWVWQPLLGHLPPDWGITTYDLRGHGQSGGAGDRMADHAADLTMLAPNGAWLVGLSIGGQIAMQAALDAPGRYAGLILCDTAPVIGSAEYYAARAARIRSEGMAPFAADQVKRWFAPAFAAAHPEVVAHAQARLAAQPVDGYLAACAAIGETDLSDDLSALDLPVLCLGGSEDVSTTPDTMCALARSLPRAEVRIIDGAGHLPLLEAPQAMADAIVEFITKDHATS